MKLHMKNILSISGLLLLFLCSNLFNSCQRVEVPTVTTAAITFVTESSAGCGGTVNNEGSSTTIVRGICWGKETNPLVSGNHTTDGSGLGSFHSYMSNLFASTKYYVRAYATNSDGTGYGNQISFNTSAPTRLAVLTTNEVVEIGSVAAVAGGNLIDDGGGTDEPVSCWVGLCWSTSQNPTISDFITSTFVIGEQSFSDVMTGLSPNTLYYVRAYATNEAGTSYGNRVSFKTLDGRIIFNPDLTYNSVSDIDGNIYKTIQIGAQAWMAENLKTTKFNDGSPIPYIADATDWSQLSAPGYCWYNNDAESFKTVIGALYNWYTTDVAGNGGKNVCPSGWHVPTDPEWTILTDYLGGLSVAGGKLKESGISHWQSPNINASNESGFTAIPGGYRSYTDGAYFSINN